MDNFPMIKRLPPYVFTVFDEKKARFRQQGIEFVDFGMGNPDQPTSPEILQEMLKHVGTQGSDCYAPSNGIAPLREAISKWYECHYGVSLDADKETIVTIGSKEGLSHLALATTSVDDWVLVPDPCYPIHKYAFTIAGASVQLYNATHPENLLEEIKSVFANSWPKPKCLVLNYPSNPTTQCIDLATFAKLVQFARQENFWILHDLAYADLCFEEARAPSILQVPGAKEVAIEAFTMSKSYNMPGWRIGFMSGNPKLVGALKHIKSYMDYGIYLPLQHAAVKALTGPQEFLQSNRELYRSRRDVLCTNLARIGWDIAVPKATMFVWAKIPEAYKHLGSLKFAEQLFEHAQVLVSPGCCFGDRGDEYVRFSLIQEDQAVLRACELIGKMFREGRGLDDASQQMNVA